MLMVAGFGGPLGPLNHYLMIESLDLLIIIPEGAYPSTECEEPLMAQYDRGRDRETAAADTGLITEGATNKEDKHSITDAGKTGTGAVGANTEGVKRESSGAAEAGFADTGEAEMVAIKPELFSQWFAGSGLAGTTTAETDAVNTDIAETEANPETEAVFESDQVEHEETGLKAKGKTEIAEDMAEMAAAEEERKAALAEEERKAAAAKALENESAGGDGGMERPAFANPSRTRDSRGAGRSRASGHTELTQTGIASWYGDNFHNGPTASGETYDMYSLTAAHRELPFNTMVKVTRLDDNRSVVVRINNRGPFTEGRIIDLSKKAAEQIGMISQGLAQVRVEVVKLP